MYPFVFILQEEGRHMLAQGYGKIINTASLNTVVVLHPEKQVAYNASKSAVVKITQTLGTEWADRGLNVNCISPGVVDTALVQVRTCHSHECLACNAVHAHMSQAVYCQHCCSPAESKGSFLGGLAATDTSWQTCTGD